MRSKCLLLFLAALLPAQQSADLDGPGWLRAGIAAYKSGQLQAAAEAFQKVIEIYPGDRSGHVYLANALMALYVPGVNSVQNLDLAKRAEREFVWVLDIDPENKPAVSSIALLTLQQAVQMPDSPEKTTKLESARAWYERVLRLDPGQKDAYYSLGLIAWSEWYPKWMNARTQCGIASGAAGPIPDAAVRSQLKDQFDSTIENAIFNFQKVLEADPKNAAALGYMDLLVRTKADLNDTKEGYVRDIQTADQWKQKESESVARPQAGAGAPEPRSHVGSTGPF